MKILVLHGTITIHGSQKEARNIEKAIYKSQRNINSVDLAKNTELEPPNMQKVKTDLKDQEETKLVPLEDAVPNKKSNHQSQPVEGRRNKTHRNFSQKQRCLRLVSLRSERSQQGYYTTLP
jgi:hypothetical protein